MKGKLIIDGNAVYEVDEECLQKKNCREFGRENDRIRTENIQNRDNVLTQKGNVV